MGKRKRTYKKRVWTASADEIEKLLKSPNSSRYGTLEHLTAWKAFARGIEGLKKNYPANKKSGSMARAELLAQWRHFYIKQELGPKRVFSTQVIAPRLGMHPANVSKILQIADIDAAVKNLIPIHLLDDQEFLLTLARAKSVDEAMALISKRVGERRKRARRKLMKDRTEVPAQPELPNLEPTKKTPPKKAETPVLEPRRASELTVPELRKLIRLAVREEIEDLVMKFQTELMGSLAARPPARMPGITPEPVPAPPPAPKKVVPISGQPYCAKLSHWNDRLSGDCREENRVPPGLRFWHTVGRKLGIYPPPNRLWGERHAEVNPQTNKTETSWWISELFYETARKYVGHYWSMNLRFSRQNPQLTPSTVHRKAKEEAERVLEADLKAGLVKVYSGES